MELRAEERLGLVSDTFVGAVVNVREQRLPPFGELRVVDGEAVVLRGDVALVRQAVHHRLDNEGSPWWGRGGFRGVEWRSRASKHRGGYYQQQTSDYNV